MTDVAVNNRGAFLPDDIVFRGKSLRYAPLLLLAGALIAAWFALELGLSTSFPTQLGIKPTVAREVAWGLGGVAVLMIVGAVGVWYEELRWVAVSRDGIRWFRNRRVHTRAWNEFDCVQRTIGKTYVNGQHISKARGAQVRFHTGKPLVVSPRVVPEFEGLLAAVEDAARRRALGWGSSPCWTEEPENAPADLEGDRSFGPLRLDRNGAEWDGVYRPWEQVQSFEVGHGYLLIQAADGSEFLHRLDDLEDGRSVVARLDVAVGAKRVSQPAAAGEPVDHAPSVVTPESGSG